MAKIGGLLVLLLLLLVQVTAQTTKNIKVAVRKTSLKPGLAWFKGNLWHSVRF